MRRDLEPHDNPRGQNSKWMPNSTLIQLLVRDTDTSEARTSRDSSLYPRGSQKSHLLLGWTSENLQGPARVVIHILVPVKSTPRTFQHMACRALCHPPKK